MKKKTLLAAALLGASGMAMAQAPLWLRNPQISPNGQEILFTYKGDIYKVPVAGGQALQLTTLSSYETAPIWSPDGKQIAFASDRKGNFDVWVMPASGGTAKQLTFNSASETPTTFSPDGKWVYFSAAIQDQARSIMFPSGRMSELYKVPVSGGRTNQVLGTPAQDVCFNAKGNFFLYMDVKGGEDAYRKHHTSSITRDVWKYDIATGKHTNLTNRAGEDRTPVLSPDGNTVYFLSERNGGSFNVWKFPLSNPAQATAVTSFKKNPVRGLSIAQNGTLCFSYDGEIYTQAASGKPKKVAISLTHDDGDPITMINYTRGLSDAAVSPNGKQVALVLRGEVFVTSVDYTTTKKITDTPEAESDVTWGPDNRTLVYASERNGKWQLVKATIARKEDLNFPNATLINEEIIAPDKTVNRRKPQFSPDGKKLAFIEEGERLMVMDVKSKKITQVTDGTQWFGTEGNFSYNWSPDSKWFCLEFIGNGRDPYSDIGIVSAEGGKITNITNSAYINTNPKWVLDGGAIMFTSNRFGLRSHASWGSQDDVLMAFVNEEAFDRYQLNKEEMELLKEAEKEAKAEADKEKKDKKDDGKKSDDAKKKEEEKSKDIVVELDKIKDRIVRVTLNSSDIAGCAINKDGDVLYYMSKVEKNYDLWKMDLRKHSTQLINKMNSTWADIQTDKDGKNFFIIGSNSINKMSNDKLTPITYSAVVKMDRAKEREYMFNHVHREVARRFYNTNMHGCDWEATVKNYRKFLPHINNNYDFANLLSEVLGELNASHTGGRYYPNGSNEPTAQLGLFFDWNYTGKGLKVDEVIEYGPFDKAKSKVRPGTIITKINGQEITVENDYTTLLNGQVGKQVLVSCKSGDKEWDEVVKPISSGANSSLLYKRWVKRQEALCDSLSGGRLGYVHLQQMNDKSYREIYEKVLGQYNKKEGIVIDTRFNGGGRLHEDIQILFSGEKYLTQVVRGRESCDMPSRRWNRPTIMLQCEANYSNAHGTPWVYKHTGMGKLVGMPVPGTMTSVSWVTMQDESLIYGIPIIGYRLADGSYLENQQLEPDIMVANDPAVIVTGRDQQLEAAVKELLQEIDAKK